MCGKLYRENEADKKVRLSWLIVLAIFVSDNCIAQSLEKLAKPNQYRTVLWTMEDGLPHDGFCTMIKDAKGFLWIGNTSNNGALCRFDGKEFKKYLPGEKEKGWINSNFVNSFEEDSLHNIWIGTDKGLSRYDIKADTFTNFLPSPEFRSSTSIIVPFWTTRNEVFCKESGFLLTAYNIHTLTKRTLSHLPKDVDTMIHWNSNHSFFDSSSKSVWMLSFKDGHGVGLRQMFLDGRDPQYYSWPCYRKTVKHSRHNAEDIAYDRNRNSVWINSGDGLLEFTLADKKYHEVATLNEIVKSKNYDRDVGMDIDRYGRIWFATRTLGILIYDPISEKVLEPLLDSIEQKEVAQYNLRLYCDRDGITWSSYYFIKGVIQLLPYNPPVVRYSPDAGKKGFLSSKNIHSIFPGPSGRLWIGTSDGLNIFDPDTGKFDVLREKDLPGIVGKYIIPISIDTIQKKAWLLAGEQNVRREWRTYEMDLKTWNCRPIIFQDGTKRLDSFEIFPFQIKPYKKGLLVCSEKYGVFEIKENILVADLSIPFSGGIGEVALVEDRILFMAHGGTSSEPNLTFENQNGKWVRLQNPLDTMIWNSMLYDSKDQSFWVSFNFELVHFNRNFEKIKSYGQEEGYNGAVYNMLMDNSGNIWFNNIVKQICRLDTTAGIITNLSSVDGYQKQNYNWFSFATKDSRGDLYFGEPDLGTTDGGLDRIMPERYSSALTSSVYLRSLTINHEHFPLSIGVNNIEKLSLRYNQNVISIETGIIDHYAKGKGYIRYKLEASGKNTDWQYAPAYFTIRYEGLPPGSYRLVMQSSNTGNVFNSPEKILILNINPAFWNTWWFRILAAIFLFDLFYLIIRDRIKRKYHLQLERSEKETQIAEMRREKAELQQQATELEMQALRAQMNPHFIFNSLNSINRFILQNNRLQASEYLTKFSKLVRIILQNSQASLVRLESEIEAMELYLDLEALRFDHRFGYKISVSPDLDREVIKVPPLIIQPYAENAIWHGLMHKEEKGQLDIEITENGEYLYFKIADNGVGRKQAAAMASKSATKHKSMGLKITAARIAILQNSNGKESPVTINDLVNEDGTAAGTEVIIKMPLIYD